jgi:hypothetical protein
MKKDYYKKKIEENAIELGKVKSRLRIFPFLKLLFFLAAVFLVIAAFQWGWDRSFCFTSAAFSLIVFLLLYRWDEYYLRRRAYYMALHSVYATRSAFWRVIILLSITGSTSSIKNIPILMIWMFSARTPFTT